MLRRTRLVGSSVLHKKRDLVSRVCEKEVSNELGGGWQESVYQCAMEVALRNRGLMYETQRVLPITFKEHVVGESIPDLVIWTKIGNQKVAIVVELKVESGLKEENEVQVQRYIQELKKQVHQNEEVFPLGLVINFTKDKASKTLNEGFELFDGVQILGVKT